MLHAKLSDGDTIPYAKEKKCKICEVKFGILGSAPQRHHCRRCGASVCHACSPNMGHVGNPPSRLSLHTVLLCV